MKLFRIRGGVHPDDCKAMTALRPIETLPLPKALYVPLHQHIGAPASPVVHRGEHVLKGQLLARGKGRITAPVHAPTSGQVVAIGRHPAHHTSGLPTETITLKPDGKDEWLDAEGPSVDPFARPPREIGALVAESGVVGMGGATFPTAVKLDLKARYALKTLVINGAECEPYLTCDDRLLQERAAAVVDGMRIMAHALGVKEIVVAIENNKPAAQAEMEAQTRSHPQISVAHLPTRYPMGSEKHLVQALTGLETPALGLTADLGVVVHNPATAAAVHDAVRLGRPLVSRVVTVSGGAIRKPKNLNVLVGTPVSDLLDYCGGFSAPPARLISGGPMMGQPLPSTRVPIVKGSNAILALTAREVPKQASMPCIRCASCVRACPSGLVPLEMANLIRTDDLDRAVDYGLTDCVACGSCAFACPSHIPLVQFFRYAKGELAARRRAEHKTKETARLAEERKARLEREKEAKRAAMAARKKKAAKAKAAKAKAKRTAAAEGA